MKYILIGNIVNTFGIKGELKIESFTDFASERFLKDSVVYLGEDHLPLTVNSFRIHKGYILASFKDCEDINKVLCFKGLNIYKSEDDIKPLDEGYYFKDLLNLDVYVNDEKAGVVCGMEEGSKYNFLRILKNDEEKLVPFIMKTFVLKVDLDNKRIDIVDMEGLL